MTKEPQHTSREPQVKIKQICLQLQAAVAVAVAIAATATALAKSECLKTCSYKQLDLVLHDLKSAMKCHCVSTVI